MSFREEIKEQYARIKELDRKVITIFLSVAVLQTISWYYTSRKFFRYNLYTYFFEDPNADFYSYLYWLTGDFFTLFLLPLLIIIFFFREKPAGYGLKWGDSRFGLKTSLIFLAVMLVIIWFVSAAPSFTAAYPVFRGAEENWNSFIIFETAMLLYMLAWEFIWRGYMLFGLEEKFGLYSVLLQMLPFVILHNGKPVIETLGSIAGAVFLGLLALRTRSVFYGVIVHYGVILSIDFISILRLRSQDYGTGLNSMFNLLKTLF